MKNVTISMDEELAREVRVEAARAGKSMSKFLAEAAREKIEGAPQAREKSNRQLEALEELFNGPKWDISENGTMPTAEERNARR